MWKRSTRVLASVLVLTFLPLLLAQQERPEAEQEPVDTLRVDVDVVNLFFNVKDKRGTLVTGLTKDDFEVYEDGQRQEIKYFAAETEQPLTLGLLIDSSGSQQRVLEAERDVAGAFLRDVLRPKDLAFLMSFDVQIELLQDFTSSAGDLRAALDRVRINTGGPSPSLIPGMGGGPFPPTSIPRGTLLHDAIYLAADEKLAREVGRKAMVILTDGQDQGSRLNLRDAVEAAQKADAICYVLLVVDREFYENSFYAGEKEMKELATQTGGRLIEVGTDIKKMRQAFEQISNELRSQYSIGYTSTNNKRDGSFRKIDIRAKKGMKIQARMGYYAPRG
jgi:VWFA-related protein